jgi:uncharacterized phage protein (TIGR02218 family)
MECLSAFTGIRSLANKLQQTQGILYSRLCRVDLGSPECGVDLGPLTDEYAIETVTAGDGFTIDTVRPSGFFTFGTCTFLSGANAGAATEILLHVNQAIRLFTPMPRPLAAGDQVRLVAGCDKTPETCHARFSLNRQLLIVALRASTEVRMPASTDMVRSSISKLTHSL